jgi:hypothetical protein
MKTRTSKPSEKLGNKIIHLLEANGNEMDVFEIIKHFKKYSAGTVFVTVQAMVDAQRMRYTTKPDIKKGLKALRWLANTGMPLPKHLQITPTRVRMPKRKTVYMSPGIYPITILEELYPSRKYRIVITKDGKKPK